MEITELHFLLFLPAVLLVYYLTPSKFRWGILLLSSVLFVSGDSLTSIGILGFTILFNFVGGQRLEKASETKEWWFWGLILGNIGVLSMFKYYNLINRSGSFFTQLTGFEWPLPHVEWLLPLGISYYIFQAVGYQTDLYLGKHSTEKHLGHFALFLAFFPKITAGPIERFPAFIQQIKAPASLSYFNIRAGGRLLLWGFFKKMFVSSQLHEMNEALFESETGGIPLLLGMFFYALEIYVDVSGYTDIALGGARLFGIKLLENFKKPFHATSITDFWRRWHISLSSWVNDYIFNPLSLWLSLRFPLGRFSLYLALFLSFFIIGIWHGSDWNFVAFGCLHGLALTFEVMTLRVRKKKSSLLPAFIVKSFSALYAMGIFIFSCQFFMASNAAEGFESIVQSLKLWENLGHLPGLLDVHFKPLALGSAFLVFDHWIISGTFEDWCGKRHGLIRWALYALLTYAIIAGSEITIEPFIYRNF